MVERHSYNQLTWIDVMNPTAEEIREVVAECDIPLEFTGDLTAMVPRSEVHAKKGVLKITLDFPVVKRTDVTHPHEIKFIATKKQLVTIRFEDIEAIHRFQKEFEVSSMLKKAGKKASGAHLLFSLLNELYRTMTVKLDYLESKMADIEEEIFNEHEKEMVFEISKVSRRLISFRQTMHSHENALEELREQVVEAFGKTYVEKVDALQNEYVHLCGRLRALTQTLDELRETNNSLVSTKQQEVMKLFTILAFVTFPLSLFTSIFGMNTKILPVVGHAYDFWIIITIMVLITICFFAFFKYKKWM